VSVVAAIVFAAGQHSHWYVHMHTRTVEVATMAGLDRSTASQYLNDLTKRKFVWKFANSYSKEVHYHVTPLVADYLELNLMDEVFGEKDKRYRYDVPVEG
jgi:hypothetical protein